MVFGGGGGGSCDLMCILLGGGRLPTTCTLPYLRQTDMVVEADMCVSAKNWKQVRQGA